MKGSLLAGGIKCANYLLVFLAWVATSHAQDLDPRAYVKTPIKGTLLIAGYEHARGGVLLDPTLPPDGIDAKVNTASMGVARSFKFFGQSAQALLVLPYGWLDATATYKGLQHSASGSGFADMRLRLSVLLLGGKAMTFDEYKNDSTRTIIGTSLTLDGPSGEYVTNRFINIGTRRWSFKPEVALSQRVGKRWMIDVYAGIWFFTPNNSYYTGSSIREQKPLAAFQSHLSYNLGPRAWAAFNSTYFVGGESSVDEEENDDQKSNLRLGTTLALPVGERSIIKIAYSKVAVITTGKDFSTLTIGWSSIWFDKPKQK